MVLTSLATKRVLYGSPEILGSVFGSSARKFTTFKEKGPESYTIHIHCLFNNELK